MKVLSRVALVFVCILALALAGCITIDESKDIVLADKEDGLIVHIKTGVDDPHTALMGLSLASAMADEVNVLVFFSVKGIELALADSPDLEHEGFKSLHTILHELKETGVKIYACPMCLKALGHTRNDLYEGIALMEKTYLFGFTDGRIVTMDF